MKIFLILLLSFLYSDNIINYDKYKENNNKIITDKLSFTFPISGTISTFNNNVIAIYSKKKELVKNIKQGKVIDIYYDYNYFSYIVSILTDDNFLEMYLNLSTVLIEEGQHITKNTDIGEPNNTKNNYLLFVAILNINTHKYINVLEYIKKNHLL